MAETFEKLLVNHEGLIFRGGRIYPESFVHPMYEAAYRRPVQYGWFLVKNYWLRRGAVPVPSGLWVIDNFSPGSYFHWVTECLPRILLAEQQCGEEHVLLLPRYYGGDHYVGFTLQAFPHITEIGWIGARKKVRVKRLRFIRQPCPNNTFIPDLMHAVADRVRRLAGSAERRRVGRRLYFTRQGARRRRAVNESDVIRVLQAHGFEIISIDPTNPAEQVRASHDASIVAGVHGG